MPSRRNSYHQSQRSKAGKSLQDIVDEANRYYLSRGLAMLMPINTGFVPAGVFQNGQMLYRPGRKVWNDTIGFIAPDKSVGRFNPVPVLGELKNRQGATRKAKTLLIRNELRKRIEKGVYSTHQYDSLLRFQELGGESFVLLWTNFGGVGDPVLSMHHPQHFNERISQKDVLFRQVHFRNGVLDYLDLIRKK